MTPYTPDIVYIVRNILQHVTQRKRIEMYGTKIDVDTQMYILPTYGVR
jgi:hypothetical protein